MILFRGELLQPSMGRSGMVGLVVSLLVLQGVVFGTITAKVWILLLGSLGLR